MSGCLRRIGCLVVLLAGIVAAWMTRDLWWERVTGRAVTDTREWKSAPADSEPRISRSAVGARSGPAFVSLSPGQLAALLRDATNTMSIPIRDPEVAIAGDRVSVRGRVSINATTVARELGPLASLLKGEQVVTLSGRPRVESKGRGVVVVDEVRIAGAEVPGPAVRAVLAQLGGRSAGSEGGEPSISFSLPLTVGDIRVVRGKLVIYRDVP